MYDAITRRKKLIEIFSFLSPIDLTNPAAFERH